MKEMLDHWQRDVERSLPLLEAPLAYHRLRVTDQGSEGLEDRVLRIASGAPLTRREIRLAGIFALVWFAMDGFWFISTLNHWFGL